MTKAINVIDAINDWTGKISSFLIWIGIGVTLCEVVLRYVFNAPTLWGYGLNVRIFAFYFLIGGGYAALHKAHISIDVIYRRFTPKVRAIVDIGLYPLFLFIVAITFIWFGSEFGLASLRTLEFDSAPPHFPIYPFKLIIPAAGFLLLLQGIAELARNIMNWRQHEH